MGTISSDWLYYRTVLAVIRLGSLTAAAKELGTTQPTVGRHIELLEEKLGAQLFIRSRTGLLPNALAESLVPHLDDMATAAEALERSVSGAADDERGVVRVTASESFGSLLLPSLLASFKVDHPAVSIELDLGAHVVDLTRKEADIAIRMFRPTQGSLIGVRVGGMPLGLYASKSYAQRTRLPKSLDQMQYHSLIGYDKLKYIVDASEDCGFNLTREMFTVRCDSELAQLAALRAGLGIGICYKAVGDHDETLVPVLEESFRFVFDVWLAMHESLRNCLRVKLLFDHLRRGIPQFCV